MLPAGAQFKIKSRRKSQDAPHGSAIFFKMFRTLRTGAQFKMKSPRKFQDAPHGSANYAKCSGCCARERDFIQNFQHAPHGSAILNQEIDGIFRMLSAISFKKFRMLRTRARFSGKLSRCSARKREFERRS